MLLALLLGTALLFYLGGLLGQLLHNYEEWMRQGGMTGPAPQPGCRKRPQAALRHANGGRFRVVHGQPHGSE